jgi:hypothetical protein
MTEFVTRQLLVKQASSNEFENLSVKVLAPVWVEEGIEADCRVVLSGVHNLDQVIKGMDPIDALQNALSFLERFLISEENGISYFWLDKEPFS